MPRPGHDRSRAALSATPIAIAAGRRPAVQGRPETDALPAQCGRHDRQAAQQDLGGKDSHAALPAQAPERAKREICRSKRCKACSDMVRVSLKGL